MRLLLSILFTIRFFCSAYLSLLVFLEISCTGLPLSWRTVPTWRPVVPLGPGGFLCHLVCSRALFLAFSFLPTWNSCMRLGLPSVNPMLTIYSYNDKAKH